MNWQLWSDTQAAQILLLREQVRKQTKRLQAEHRRAELWRLRALRKAAKR